MNNYLVFDTETVRSSHEVEGGFDNIADFGLAVCAMNHSNGRKLTYLPNGDVTALLPIAFNVQSRRDTQSLFDSMDAIVSFNANGFDFEVMQSAGFDTTDWREKSVDILARLYEAAGHRISLDNLAHAVLGKRKTLNGELAVQYWRGGLELIKGWAGIDSDNPTTGFDDAYTHQACLESAKHLFSEVINYCQSDVQLTHELYLRLLENPVVKYLDKNGNIRTVEVDVR